MLTDLQSTMQKFGEGSSSKGAELDTVESLLADADDRFASEDYNSAVGVLNTFDILGSDLDKLQTQIAHEELQIKTGNVDAKSVTYSHEQYTPLQENYGFLGQPEGKDFKIIDVSSEDISQSPVDFAEEAKATKRGLGKAMLDTLKRWWRVFVTAMKKAIISITTAVKGSEKKIKALIKVYEGTPKQTNIPIDESFQTNIFNRFGTIATLNNFKADDTMLTTVQAIIARGTINLKTKLGEVTTLDNYEKFTKAGTPTTFTPKKLNFAVSLDIVLKAAHTFTNNSTNEQLLKEVKDGDAVDFIPIRTDGKKLVYLIAHYSRNKNTNTRRSVDLRLVKDTVKDSVASNINYGEFTTSGIATLLNAAETAASGFDTFRKDAYDLITSIEKDMQKIQESDAEVGSAGLVRTNIANNVVEQVTKAASPAILESVKGRSSLISDIIWLAAKSAKVAEFKEKKEDKDK